MKNRPGAEIVFRPFATGQKGVNFPRSEVPGYLWTPQPLLPCTGFLWPTDVANAPLNLFTVLMEDQPSDRIIDQRVRNRIMEAVQTLADGDDGVRRELQVEYFESFYDWIPHRGDGAMRPNSAITAEEQAVLLEVSSILDDACDTTPRHITADELIATGWPKRIQPVALKALNLMRDRGRFSEEREEDAPSITEP
jgi:hypothetical protein